MRVWTIEDTAFQLPTPWSKMADLKDSRSRVVHVPEWRVVEEVEAGFAWDDERADTAASAIGLGSLVGGRAVFVLVANGGLLELNDMFLWEGILLFLFLFSPSTSLFCSNKGMTITRCGHFQERFCIVLFHHSTVMQPVFLIASFTPKSGPGPGDGRYLPCMACVW